MKIVVVRFFFSSMVWTWRSSSNSSSSAAMAMSRYRGGSGSRDASGSSGVRLASLDRLSDASFSVLRVEATEARLASSSSIGWPHGFSSTGCLVRTECSSLWCSIRSSPIAVERIPIVMGLDSTNRVPVLLATERRLATSWLPQILVPSGCLPPPSCSSVLWLLWLLMLLMKWFECIVCLFCFEFCCFCFRIVFGC